jgi:DNA-binding transcriptional MerR regulator
MRIAELSRRSGVSIPTIKYYLREGLMAPGAASGPNQADYDEAHLRRLALIRSLIDVGGVSIAGVREVLQVVDDDRITGHELLGAAHWAISPPPRASRTGTHWVAARDRASAAVARLGWQVAADAPALDALADAVAALTALGQDDLVARLDDYATAAEQMAAGDVQTVLARGPADRTAVVEGVVLGTVLGGAMFAALRMLAQEHASYLATRTPLSVAPARLPSHEHATRGSSRLSRSDRPR